MKAIGFANKYYTAWEISETTYSTLSGSRTITNYCYLRNLSMDLEKAKEKFDGEFVEGLRGYSKSFEVVKEIEDNTKFKFGKYQGKHFDEVNDLDYMKWYFNECDDEPRKENLKCILLASGYHFGKGEICYNDEEWSKIIKLEKESEIAMKRIIDKDVDFIATKNLSIDYTEDDFAFIIENHIMYRFRDFLRMYYNGCEYALPNINGKGKRIKNKKVVVLEFNVIDLEKRIIEVTKFKIGKI